MQLLSASTSDMLPGSEHLNISALSGLFQNTTNSYKYIFFISLLELIKGRNFQADKPILLSELTVEMLAIGWFPHTYFKLSFGSQDTLGKKLDSLNFNFEKEVSSVTATDKKKLREMIGNANLGSAQRLMDFVPYRLLIPFLSDELKGVNKGAWMILERAMPRIANAAFNTAYPLYRFNSDEYGKCDKLLIHDKWAWYFRDNYSILFGWAAWHWLQYMQRRNPTTPGISNKLFPPTKRDSLANQSNYWRDILSNSPDSDFYCNFSGASLLVDDFSLDHYLPWSFLAHDQLWNLAPISRQANSSKSNSIPSSKYLADFISLQHRGLVVAERILPRTQFKKVTESFVSDLHLESMSDLFDLRALTSAYEKTLQPLTMLAINQGFSPGWEYIR